MPMYDTFYTTGDYDETKKAYKLTLWGRPTIPWKLSCEIEDKGV